MSKIIRTRTYSTPQVMQLTSAGMHPLLAQLLVARGVSAQHEIDSGLKHLIPPDQLLNSNWMAQHLVECITQQRKILVVGDYLRSLNFYYLNK